MIFVCAVVLFAAILSTLFRAIVLSSKSDRFIAHDIWKYDVLSRHVWLWMGTGLILLPIIATVQLNQWFALAITWVVSVAMVWLLPSRLLGKSKKSAEPNEGSLTVVTKNDSDVAVNRQSNSED